MLIGPVYLITKSPRRVDARETSDKVIPRQYQDEFILVNGAIWHGTSGTVGVCLQPCLGVAKISNFYNLFTIYSQTSRKRTLLGPGIAVRSRDVRLQEVENDKHHGG